MKRSLNDGYDSRDVFISPSGSIAMINRAINRGYDFRDFFFFFFLTVFIELKTSFAILLKNKH